MKRLLSSLLCALLLLALVPLAAPGARMVTGYTLTLTGLPARVGGTIHAAITNVDGPAPHQYAFKLYRKGSGGYDFVKDVPGMTVSSTTDFQVAEPGTYALYTVAWDATTDGELLWSPDFTVSLRPAANITSIAALSGTALKIVWGAVAGATGYEVQRSGSATGPWTAVKWTTAASFSNAWLTAGNRYYYKVAPYNIVDGIKVLSGPFGAVAAGVPLGKAVIASATGTGKDRVKLTWAAVPGATGYQVLMAQAAGGPYAPAGTTTALTYVKTGLLADKTYFFQVRASKRFYTTSYYGPASAYKSAKTLK